MKNNENNYSTLLKIYTLQGKSMIINILLYISNHENEKLINTVSISKIYLY